MSNRNLSKMCFSWSVPFQKFSRQWYGKQESTWYCGGVYLWSCCFVIRGWTRMRAEVKFHSVIQGMQNKVQMSLMQVDETNWNVCSFSKLVVFFATLDENILRGAYKRLFRFRGKQLFASIFMRVMKYALEEDFPLLASNIMLMLLLPIILGSRPDQWHAGNVGKKFTFGWITCRFIRTSSETDAGLYQIYWRIGWKV